MGDTAGDKVSEAFPNFPLNITIKQEKLSPIRAPAADDDDSTTTASDTKTGLHLDPPPKSSDEILAELFGVLNAQPPSVTVKKEKKKKSSKEKKHKKVKKEKKSDGEVSDTGGDDLVLSGEEGEIRKKKKKKRSSREGSETSQKKHKKHKKHKIKKEKRSDEDEPKSKRLKSEEKVPEPSTSRSGGSSKHREKSRERDKKDVKEKPRIQIRSLVNSSIVKEAIKANEKEKERHSDKSSSRKRRKSESDFSFSDEEDTSKSHKYRNPYAKAIKTEPGTRSKYYDGYRRHDDRDRHRRRSRERDYGRSRRSRSKDRLDIDKKKLLEIARKNAILMLKNGTLPGAQSLSQETKDKLMAKVRCGGKSVSELTDYCKKLSNGEMEVSDISDAESGTEEKPFHHPFELKERGPIVMNIANAKPIAPKSAEQKKELLKLFPVSSGQEHRQTETEWRPVEPPAPVPKAVEKPVKNGPLAIMQPPPAPVTPSPAPAPTPVQVPEASPVVAQIPMPSQSIEPHINTNNQFNVELANSWKESNFGFSGTQAFVADTSNQQVFAQQVQAQNIDVNSVISNRLDAMRKLQDNPHDIKAVRILEETQKKMTAWASSKYTPGQFLGTTGANLLSAKELAGHGAGAWARKNTLTSSRPVDSGMGMHLLQKMGWKPGEGLGKDKTGSTLPLLLEVKNDRRGLVSNMEYRSQNPKMKPRRPLRMSLEGKHPVSLLGEISLKRKWGTPQYEVAMEQGPGHAKLFIYKVRINGMEYQPAVASNTKKDAKLVSAKFCLQQMGILPT